MKIESSDIISVIDHTFLKNDKQGVSLEEQIKKVKTLCHEAHRFNAFSVCVRPEMVKTAFDCLLGSKSSVKVCSVVGFPDGDDYLTSKKIEELKKARDAGAVEFDMVMRVRDLKLGNEENVFKDFYALAKEAKKLVLKVIFENVYLNDVQKIKAYEICRRAFLESGEEGVRFFKSSTGFAVLPEAEKSRGIGATLEDIKLMHSISKGVFGIKPAGGINDFATAILFWEAIGKPATKLGKPDPYKFRIGSSSLLNNLIDNKIIDGGY